LYRWGFDVVPAAEIGKYPDAADSLRPERLGRIDREQAAKGSGRGCAADQQQKPTGEEVIARREWIHFEEQSAKEPHAAGGSQ
jgi:hypothetical protein